MTQVKRIDHKQKVVKKALGQKHGRGPFSGSRKVIWNFLYEKET
jgi:hypothetical protein